MIRYPNLIPECNVDTVFVEALGYPGPNHAASINEVCAILEKKGPHGKAIGFIDNDKKRPAYLADFDVVEDLGNVRLLKHATKRQHLIVVTPAMDRFIFDLCTELGIDLALYSLPTRFVEFLSKTKREAIRRDPKFKNLLNTIRQRNPPKIVKIRSWIAAHHD
jgi:hypothetical protein